MDIIFNVLQGYLDVHTMYRDFVALPFYWGKE
jgi:hypothetical protein